MWGAEVGALDGWRSRPAVALRVRLRASPSAQDDTASRMCGAGVCALDDWRSRPAVALRVRLRASPSAQDDMRRRNVRPKFGFAPDLLDFRHCF